MATRKNMPRQTVSASRVERDYIMRFDPIPNLTPERLVAYHAAFRRGYLRDAARTWEAIAERDAQVATVVSKRGKSMRYGIEYVMSEGEENNPRAQQHKDALQYFYDNLRCTNVLDQNERGGSPLLIRQMMSAIGMRYAVHEIVWDPRPGNQLTATFYQCPLAFFENTTGRLRYLETEGAQKGVELEEGQWVTTVGDGLMIATATAYMYKNLSLRDLLNYCERYAIPGMHGITDAQPGTQEWDTLVNALHNFAVDFAMVTSSGAKIEKIDMSASGEVPHPKLVEYMDRAITLIWRGGDLSTMSRGQDGVGASVQKDEMEILEHDDAQVITDTLNEQVDRWVIGYLYGEDPLCWVKVRTAQRRDIKQDLDVDRQLFDMGVPMSAEQMASRYGRTLPDAGQKILKPHQGAAVPPQTHTYRQPAAAHLANARTSAEGFTDLSAEAVLELAVALQGHLKPLAVELQAIYARAEADDFTDADLARELIALRERLPDMMAELAQDESTAQLYSKIMAAAWANGIEEAVEEVQA